MNTLLAAFVVGLFGSLHCVGMCGPIALALPLNRKSKTTIVLGSLTYNFGRISTYAILGLFIGKIGQAISLVGWLRYVSIAAGILLLIYVLFAYVIKASIPSPFGKWNLKIGSLKGAMAKQFGRNSTQALFSIGVLNGLLPCGFVYFALLGALGTGDIFAGASYMALFGLGTLPIMLAANLLGAGMSQKIRGGINRAIPFTLVFFGILFILRGMSLGIPFVSPIIRSVEPVIQGCH